MALPAEAVNALLLDLLAPGQVMAERFSAWQPEDWQRLLKACRQHRLGPLLYWRLSHEHQALSLPDSIQHYARNSFQQGSLKALQWQRELLLCRQVLQAAGIPCLALKGAFLATSAYPHPALRPMRDLDLLVPMDQGLAAFSALLAAGYRRTAGHEGDPAACLAHEKHLPGLKAPSGNITVELHVRLCSSEHLPPALHLYPGIWQRVQTQALAGAVVAYPAVEDLLLHVALHAVYEHRFNNGPLTLADVAYLLQSRRLDWPLFWSLAEQWGASRGVALLLLAVERYYGDLGIEHLPGRQQDWTRQLDDSLQLMLGDAALARMVPLAARLAGKSHWEKLRLLWRELWPDAHRLQAENQQAQPGLQRLWVYLKRPFSGNRLAEVQRSRQDPEFRQSVQRYAAVDDWLGQPPPGAQS